MEIISVNNLSKTYKRYPSKWARVKEWVTGKNEHKPLEVLKNISFKVHQGESVGFIGHNGAGKSTLLKILTGTTYPSNGTVTVQGKIAALLELGVGFHPDFTGIQNIYMLGQIMGLNNAEIDNLLPDIIDFAEIGDYLNEPVRTYSSGMAVRLAFSTATAVRPDILIVDEALSVGDSYFQHKCFSRIRKFREEGTSLLFVSHDPSAVKNLCDRAILLDQGVAIKDGHPDEILDYYNAIIAKREAENEINQSIGHNKKLITRSGNKDISISAVKILLAEKQVSAVQVGDEITLRVEMICNKKVNKPTVGFIIRDRLGNDIFGTNTYYLNNESISCRENEKIIAEFHLDANLGPGTYNITVAVHDQSDHLTKNYDWYDHAATFQVISGKENYFNGVSYLETTVNFRKG
ncbi:ABC transporter ATP-binding protein [Paenibacillus sp. FSL H7-0756]|uniref:ABC transporter ATP-binding protein n=1 Tax=Paenibacillus sp. FSL H7-0756 TaxID=2954738 RepID=UPI0030FBBDE9